MVSIIPPSLMRRSVEIQTAPLSNLDDPKKLPTSEKSRMSFCWRSQSCRVGWYALPPSPWVRMRGVAPASGAAAGRSATDDRAAEAGKVVGRNGLRCDAVSRAPACNVGSTPSDGSSCHRLGASDRVLLIDCSEKCSGCLFRQACMRWRGRAITH